MILFSTYVLVELPLLLGAVVGILLIHPLMGAAAVDSLAALGILDPKLGVPLLLTVMFYSNIFTRKDVINHDMLVTLPFCILDCCLIYWIAFYFVSNLCRVLCFCFSSSVLQLKVFEMLPSLASHSAMVPLVVQTILPLLNKDAGGWVLC